MSRTISADMSGGHCLDIGGRRRAVESERHAGAAAIARLRLVITGAVACVAQNCGVRRADFAQAPPLMTEPSTSAVLDELAFPYAAATVLAACWFVVSLTLSVLLEVAFSEKPFRRL